MSAKSGSSTFRTVFIVSGGNFLEMYDFMVYGYYAGAIAKAYFPSDDPYASTMAAFAAFGAGFLMRPIGAIVLGAVIDRHGRRTGLLLTLGLMAVGTLAIAATPAYARIGLAAPLLVLAGRLVQGLSAGVELGGVSVYLSEIASTGQPWLRGQLAVGEPAGRPWCSPPPSAWPPAPALSKADDGGVGLANPVRDRLRAHPVPVLHSPRAAGDAGVSGARRSGRPWATF